MVKKGIFFSIDALIASMLILFVVVLIPVFYSAKQSTVQPVYFSSDLVQLLSTIKIGEINETAFVNLINSSDITNLNRTILEQALWFQVGGDEDKASELLNLTIAGLVPDYYGVGVWVEGYEDPIYTTSQEPVTQLISSKEMVSGIEKSKAIEGVASRVLLSGINERTSSAFTYFGGYEGDGNITKKIFLPDDINYITSAYMELDAGSDFDLYINGNPSGHYIQSGNMGADSWDIDAAYLNNFHWGENTIMLSFNGENRYVGGGYFRVDYSTSELTNYEDNGIKKYYFPGIKGIINVYSSFYVPGSLNSMKIYLHYKSDFEVFLNIGDETVFSYDLAGENIVNIPDGELSLKLDYSSISNKTVPIRMSIRNVSYVLIGFGGTADSMLVTDVSGSMDECGEYNSTLMCGYDCCVNGTCPDSYSCQSDTCVDEECGACPIYEQICYYKCCRDTWWGEYCPTDRTCYNDSCVGIECGSCGTTWWGALLYPRYNESYVGNSSAQNHNQWYDTTCVKSKLDIAKEADKEFVDVVLNVPDNRVGLVSYSTSTQDTHGLTNDKNSLYNEIDGYNANGWTCICCGVISATNILLSQSNETRTKSMLVMTDGEANRDCDMDPVPDHDEDSDTTDDPQDHAIQAACDAHELYNITVYTVGFGDISSLAQETLDKMAECGGGKYVYTNVSNLTTIYQGIAEEIINFSYQSQTIVSFGEVYANTTLFPDSYIEFNYTPQIQPWEYRRIPVIIESPRFNNNITEGTFYIPNTAEVYDAKVTSYSSDKWTDKALIKDNGNWINFYNLSYYNDDYHLLGDPYIVNIPIELIKEGENTVRVSTGVNPINSTGGSGDDRAIYTIGLKIDVNYTGVFEKAEGCNWFIKFEDGTDIIIPIPLNYSGAKNCNFNETTNCDVEYGDDAIDNSICYLFKQLDFDGDGLLFVKIGPGDLKIETFSIGGVPYMWGPTIAEVRVWK